LPPRLTTTPEPSICPNRMALHARIDGDVSYKWPVRCDRNAVSVYKIGPLLARCAH